jgi:lipoprotein signal peptidase
VKEFVLKWFEKAMTEADVNSRLVFLLQGLVTIASILVLAIAFIFSHDRSAYPTFMTALVGGGIGSALGRMFTKMGNKGSNAEKS